MYEMCIDDFLTKSSPSYVEKHLDSSDFETPCNSSNVGRKGGRHNLLRKKKLNKYKDVATRHMCDNFQLYSFNTQYNRNVKENSICPKKQVIYSNKFVDCASNNNKIDIVNNINNKRNQTFKKKCSSKLSLSNIGPCLSTLSNRTNNKNSKMKSIRDSNYCDNAYCAYCEHQRTKKFNKSLENYTVQSVGAVAKNILKFPFQRVNDYLGLSQANGTDENNSDDSYEFSLSSGSEHENIKTYKHRKVMKYIMNKFEKRIRGEYANVSGTIKHKNQQYPSKLNLKSPCQVFVSSSCQTKYASTDSEAHSILPSNSSEFWDFLLQRIKYQIHKTEVSKDKATNDATNICDIMNMKDPCDFFKSTNSNTNTNKPKVQSKCSKQCPEKQNPNRKNIDKYSSEVVTPPKNKNEKSKKCICKCPNKEKSPHLKQSSQEQHDAFAKQLCNKYNGEILCIHNPPCVVINGCLNLPPPKGSTGEGTFIYPVAKPKKSSFADMCRKIKRCKQKSHDQAVQYQPPFTNLQELLPEFKTEKIIQSVCNHSPPCEVVHGCLKPSYNPVLQTSCVHVPLCPKFPECLLEQRNIEHNTCDHQPKCTELPLCTRKYILLTAKDNATTQVKPKTKIGCQHQPPCLMIPKCLAQAICGDWIPGNAIPGCVHQPNCEMIPACSRKQHKESVSVPSQYHSAPCPIV